MACNPLNPITVSKENPQNADNNDSALDKVVDPLIEFHVSYYLYICYIATFTD